MNEHTTDAPSNLEATMRRIAKLLAIAQDGRGDPNEAAAAARMAESIMRKYQIEHADLISVELNKGAAESFADEDVGSSLDPEGKSKESSGWSGILAVAVAKLHDCQARFVRTAKHGKTLRFSGYAADAQMARFTYCYLVSQMVQATKAYQRECSYNVRAESEAFRRGFNTSVCKLLADARRAKLAEMQSESASRGLVVLKDNAVAKHFGDIRYRSAGSYRTRQGDAYSSGREQGSRVDVNRRGIEGGRSSGNVLIGA
jgi:hypothetical protein